jgi:hypothetical protein
MVEELSKAEKHIFRVIEKVFNHFKKSEFTYVVGDSTSIRAFTPFKRDIEDIDIIFPFSTGIEELQEFIFKKFPDSKFEKLRTVVVNAKVGYFLRTKFDIDISYNGDNFFIVDYHVGGSVYKEKFGCEVDDTFFENRKWMTVKSFNEYSQVELPVAKIEEVLLFKLKKFLNKDMHDVMSLLTSRQLDLSYLNLRIDYYGRSQIIDNLLLLEEKKNSLYKTWQLFHGVEFSTKNMLILDDNLSDLKRTFNGPIN